MHTGVFDGQRQNSFAVSVVEMNQDSVFMTHLSCQVHTSTTLAIHCVVVGTIQHQLKYARQAIVFSCQVQGSCVSNIRIYCNTPCANSTQVHEEVILSPCLWAVSFQMSQTHALHMNIWLDLDSGSVIRIWIHIQSSVILVQIFLTAVLGIVLLLVYL